MADYDILVFSWNDIFPSRSKTGQESDLVNETFTFGGGGDIVTYRDNDSFSGSFGDHGFVTNRIFGVIDGVSEDDAQVNPEYAYAIKDSSGTTVGNMYAITDNTADLSRINAFTFDFQPIQGETYTLASIDTTPSTSYSNLYVCFTSGTLIDTDHGPVKVEELCAGDKVLTRDNGAQPVVWIGLRTMSYQHLALNSNTRPILIEACALGLDRPSQPLVVSPQHRMLISSKIIKRMTFEQEIMVPAKKLLELDGVEEFVPDTGVTYHHILCKAHEIVVANGTFAETLFLGDQSNEMLRSEDLKQIEECCPGLIEKMTLHPLAAAGRENRNKVKNLIRRHAKNNKPIMTCDRPTEAK